MAKNEDNWMSIFEALKAHVAITGHFPDKHSTLNNWVRYQRKRMKAGIMPEEQKRLFIDPSFAAVCTINRIKVVKYQHISAK